MNAPSPRAPRHECHANRGRGRRAQPVLFVLVAVIDLIALGIVAFEVRALWPLLAFPLQ